MSISPLAGALISVTTLLVPAPPPAATTPVTTFTMAHSGSYESDANGHRLPRGALLTIFPDSAATDETQIFSPWVTATPHGLSIQASCSAEDALINLPILYASPLQINTYLPNDVGTEPYGICSYTGPTPILLHTTTGQVIEHDLGTVPSHPGGFLEGDGVTPVGFHQSGTRVLDCRTGDKSCPLSAGGVPALLRLYLTGAELFTCAGCQAGIQFLFNGRKQATVDVQTVSLGVEVATIRLTDVSGPGTYQVTITSTAPQQSSEVMQVRLSPAV
ncbi:MAG TPA: hypothetical protein VJT31_15700 [Rugosimonospora sp.]|nr:hypothetical protein [Rugosimonospora sp.]